MGRLDQPEPLEAGVAFFADDDVVVHGDAERLGDVDDRLRQADAIDEGSRVKL